MYLLFDLIKLDSNQLIEAWLGFIIMIANLML
jgi:hypothetical protein